MRILGVIASSVRKGFAAFSDTFNRTTSGSLGTSSSGGLWNALKGVWYANGNAAKTDDAASTYPIANIEMTSASVTASITTGSWVQISTTGTVGSISSNSADSTTYFTATITGMSSTTGMATGQRIRATNGTGTLFGGTPDYIEITSVVSSTSIIYRTKGGTTPTAGSVSNIETSNNDGGSGIALWITDSGNWWGVAYGRSINTSCNCQTCNTSFCNGGYQNYQSVSCTGGTFTSFATACTGGTFTAFQNVCTAGYTRSFQNPCSGGFTVGYTNFCTSGTSWQITGYCGAPYTQAALTYTCSTYKYVGSQYCLVWQKGAGFTPSSYTCLEWNINTSCNTWSQGGGTYTCTNPGTARYAFLCGSGTYAFSAAYTCNGFSFTSSTFCGGFTSTWAPSCPGGLTWGYVSCNCQTCYPPYIRLFKSVSSSVSEVTRWTLGSMAAAFKVVTDAVTKTITIKPFRDVAMTSQIGSDLTSTQTTATMEKKFGIVLSPSDNIQGSTLDDFDITSN